MSNALLGLGAVELVLYPPFVLMLSSLFLTFFQNAVVYIDKRASEASKCAELAITTIALC